MPASPTRCWSRSSSGSGTIAARRLTRSPRPPPRPFPARGREKLTKTSTLSKTQLFGRLLGMSTPPRVTTESRPEFEVDAPAQPNLDVLSGEVKTVLDLLA